jgi:hypothetical protein
VILMAHVLGSQDGSGSLRLAGLSRLTAAAQEKIVERCVVDGMCVVITQNLDNFVDFERWIDANCEAAAATTSSLFGSRIDPPTGERNKFRPKPDTPAPQEPAAPQVTPEPQAEAPSKTTSEPPPARDTVLFGPQFNISIPKAGPKIETPPPRERFQERSTPPATPFSQAQKPDRRKPRVFWRDVPEPVDLVNVSAQPEPAGSDAIIPPKVVSPSIEPEPIETNQPDIPLPQPVALGSSPESLLDQGQKGSKPGRTPSTLNLSSPRIDLGPRGNSAQRFTEVVSGRKQATLDGSQPVDAGADQDEKGFPKWMVITLIVVVIIAVVIIVIGVLN